ncbi:hypothetical protein GFH30_04520 [Acinetobacter wanghuae]|uniref:Uncharacterized protein n=1 Tax=Acinetobacter wanghuae TaxID=2662362 RepID=A0A5Q0P2C9_9GAMM|nr:hypothetical protein [Acinetobacter wanghuae]MQW92126.1 hypothetical protein [Acinetobacter wanghuae]QGA10703.1 hypothetical protein GFH30_04520 [Acinetobacter wanghuae]
MSEQPQPRSIKKLVILGTLGLCVPILLVSVAFLAVNSDAKNQEKYKQQHAEMLERIEARKVAEQAASERTIQPK